MIASSGKIDVTVMKRMGARGKKGFASVMIASVVMLIVLLSGLVAASSANTAIRDQYKQKVMQMATDAGVAMVDACLAQSYNAVTWAGKVLRPNTNCNGDPIGGSAYVMDTPTLKTTFEVPELTIENGTQRANVTGKVLSYRASGAGTPVESNTVRSALIGGQTGFSNVAFGYCSDGNCGVDGGMQLAVVLATGEVKALGRNSNGRLGNGTLTDSALPSVFKLPVGERGIAAYTNFLSIGRQFSVMTASGKVYSAGSNQVGQLGNTASGTTSPVRDPVQFSLPAGVNARYVAINFNATYVIADNNRIYAAGNCDGGSLGSGCSSGPYATPVQVALPSPTSDLNTQPETVNDWVQSTNFATDGPTAFVRMKGGDVYGWGPNQLGMLGDGTTNTSLTPKLIRALSSSASPRAKQIATSGRAMHILDTEGQVWITGGESSTTGELAGAGANVKLNNGSDICIAKDTSSNLLLQQACSKTNGWQFMEWWPDKTWRFRTDSYSYAPTASMLCATAPAATGLAAGYEVRMLPCSGAANQQWDFRSNRTIYSNLLNACVVPSGSLFLVACNGTVNQEWTVQNSVYLRPVPSPPGNPKAVRISTDAVGIAILYENGEVWMSGSNNRGQLGNGESGNISNPVLKKVILPAGRKAVDIYVTEVDQATLTGGLNAASANNSFFVLDDGSVYGAGGNNYGQLGIGTTTDAVATPIKMQLPNGVEARSVRAAYGTTIVISTKGRVYTVGNNSNGQLGDGTTSNSYLPKANVYTNQRSTIVY